ncbi:MAG: VWA domain-containing protein [Planctomycetes bacterium]|nr:VWA domain-containing protein [Planctomycetota bacterium]
MYRGMSPVPAALRAAAAFAALVALALPAFAEERPAPPRTPDVDIVFCIDQSGSMEQIIAAAKQKIWSIVNEMATARPTPNLRIGLLGYGYDPFLESTGFLHVYTDLSSDLDAVNAQLMKLTTQGSKEYVGQAIHEATSKMSWSASPDALRLIYMVGNERADQDADQGRLGYRVVAKRAIEKGIVVNTIYGGDTELALAEPQWQEIARLTDGAYARIDLSGGVVSIATPYDEELVTANTALNGTFVPFGRDGKDRMLECEKQDANAAASGSAAAPREALAQRAASKAGKLYKTDEWDLVEASSKPEFKLEDVKDEDLPADLRGKSVDEKRAWVAKKSAERAAVRRRIQELTEKREAFVREEMKKQSLDADKGFDGVVRRSLREEAAKKGLRFEEKK